MVPRRVIRRHRRLDRVRAGRVHGHLARGARLASRLVEGFGISVNRWEPQNVLKALDTGLVDSVQVVYNVFDQAPEDVLFPVCERLKVGVIARRCRTSCCASSCTIPRSPR
jgi:hypothetical protein